MTIEKRGKDSCRPNDTSEDRGTPSDVTGIYAAEAQLAIVTFLCFVAGDILSSQPLVQNIQHFPAEINKHKRQRSRRHLPEFPINSAYLVISRIGP